MKLGRVNNLTVLATGPEGVVVGTRQKYILLPVGEAPRTTARGDRLRVFVTVDDDGHLRGSMQHPTVEAGGFAQLPIVDVSAHGAFADWGLPKDLLIPMNKQYAPLRVGDRPVVAVALGPRGRCYGSTWIAQYLDMDPYSVQRGQPVDLLVYGRNDHGLLAVVDDRWSGMLSFDTLAGERPRLGDRLQGWVNRVLEDGRLDCGLKPIGGAGRTHDQGVVLDALREAGGRLDLTDRSPPGAIRSRLGLSKKAFKRAIGGLYKDRQVQLHPDHIALVERG